MSELQESPTTPLLRLRRWWWVAALAGLAAGAATFLLAQPGQGRAVGVINVRPLASLPNDRIDLIADLQAALDQPSVLSGPADRAGLTVTALRESLTVERIGSSNLVAVSLVTDEGNEAGQRIVEDVVSSASEFVLGEQGTKPPEGDIQVALEQARAEERAASEAMFAAILANGGQAPDVALQELRARSGSPTSEAELAAIQQAVESAAEYDQLEAELERARAAVAIVNELAIERAVADADTPRSIPVEFQEGQESRATESPTVRRALAASLAAASLVAAAIAFGLVPRISPSGRRTVP